MDITAQITGIQYKPILIKELNSISLDNLDINIAPSSFLINDQHYLYAISKWVSPKRTRSYPYERVYNTLGYSKKITIIPIVKDEGIDGDRDFLQWDTVSLMSLLDVYVIIAYYSDAKINPRKKTKITKQTFDQQYIIDKIREIKSYHSSALHWNLKELNENLLDIIEKAKIAYSAISNKLEVQLHNEKGLIDFQERISGNIAEFMNYSRDKAKSAQNREIHTMQPKEVLIDGSKSKITITNYLGGKYYLTADEVQRKNNKLEIIEAKYSRNSLLPSIGDIKDGLIKMFIFSNLTNSCVDGNQVEINPILKLTSKKIIGVISSRSSQDKIKQFFDDNFKNSKYLQVVEKLFLEANTNNFELIISEINS